MGNAPLCSEGNWEHLQTGPLFRAACDSMDPSKLRKLLAKPQFRGCADAVDGDGCVMLHTLALKGCEHDQDLAHELVRIIVIEHGGTVDAHQYQTGETPLMLAIQWQRYSMVRALVETGRCTIGHRDCRERSELDLAEREVEKLQGMSQGAKRLMIAKKIRDYIKNAGFK